jgi:hypothetical protein
MISPGAPSSPFPSAAHAPPTGTHEQEGDQEEGVSKGRNDGAHITGANSRTV